MQSIAQWMVRALLAFSVAATVCGGTDAPVIISPLAIFGNSNRELVYQIVATGDPQSYVATNLPAGLALDPISGIISGIPVNPGTTDVSITASNGQGMDTKTLQLTIFNPSSFPNPPFIANVGSLTARTGQPFALGIVARGLDAGRAVSAGSAPGIMFRPLTDDLVGAPQEEGSFAINFIIHSAPPLDDLIYNMQTLQVTFVSDPALPVITSAASVILAPRKPFTYTITAPTSAMPNELNRYSLIGTLPSGLIFDPEAGTISGTYSPAARQVLDAGVGPTGSFVETVTLVAQNSHGVATLPLTFLLPSRDRLLNVSARALVQPGDKTLIGGFIIGGTQSRKVLIRGIGPSLTAGSQPVPGRLTDPVLQLYHGNTLMATNDNWRETQESEIAATMIPPNDNAEAAIVATLQPGAYTAILRGHVDETGIGLVEIYDLDNGSDSKLANVSARAEVNSGDFVLIAGFILGMPDRAPVLVRALGPSLASSQVPDPIPDPMLELHNANGTLLYANDNWTDTQQGEIAATTIPPPNDKDSAILIALPPGAYTAIVREKNNIVGNGLVEIYLTR